MTAPDGSAAGPAEEAEEQTERRVAVLRDHLTRVRTGLTLAEGSIPVQECLASRPDAVQELIGTPWGVRHHRRIVQDARDRGIPVRTVGTGALARMTVATAPQSIIAVTTMPAIRLGQAMTGARLVAVAASTRVEEVASVALAARVDALVLCNYYPTALYNPDVLRALSGIPYAMTLTFGPDVAACVDHARRNGLQCLAAAPKLGHGGTDAPTGTYLPRLGERLARPTAWFLGGGVGFDRIEAVGLGTGPAIWSAPGAIAAACLFASRFAMEP